MNERAYLEKLLEGENLTTEETRDLFLRLMSGEVPPPLFAGILVALRAKGETLTEIVGAAQAMRELMVKVQAPEGAVDLCGTGGDRQSTLNVSTATALLMAALGYPVAKHGNRAVSSTCGSADLVEALGLPAVLDPQEAESWLKTHRFAFLFAPRYHPAMKHAVEPRKALGVRTIFNLLGPLANPAQVKQQLLGVFSRAYLSVLAQALKELGTKRALLVHGEEGLDEVSPEGATYYVELKEGQITEGTFTPSSFGAEPVPLSQLKVQSREEARERLLRAFKGEDPPFMHWIALNTACALRVVAGTDLKEGYNQAHECLSRGEAYRYLSSLPGFSP